jgi:hypothetical protein
MRHTLLFLALFLPLAAFAQSYTPPPGPSTAPLSVNLGKIVIGSDATNQNIELGNGTGGTTPYLDFNGNGVSQSVRLLNDADGQLTFLSDGTQNVRIRKNQSTLFTNGVTSQTQLTANSGGIVLGSDSTNQNLELGNASVGTTPYIDFNGNGVGGNVRILNDGDGNLTFSSDGTWNFQLRKNQQTVFNYGVTTANAVSGGSLNSSSGYAYSGLPSTSGYAISAMVYCLDCLKPAESTGSGTGAWVFNDGTGNWKSMLSGAVAAH